MRGGSREGRRERPLDSPKKAGTYILHCQIVCGPGHADMALTIVVTDASAGSTP